MAGKEQQLSLIERFKALPPNIVYTLAPKDFVLRGYDYFQQERLESFRWEQNRSLLTAVVHGKKRYAVECWEEEGELEFLCNCPAWRPTTQCKHVICALFTIINLLSPLNFKVRQHQPRRLEQLRTALLLDEKPRGAVLQEEPSTGSESSPRRQGYELVIHLRDWQPELFVRHDGQRLYTLRGVPDGLTYFVGNFYHSFPVHRDRFGQFLQVEGNRYPITLESDGESIPVKWEGFHRCEIHTALDVRKDRVTCRPVYRLDGRLMDRVKLFWEYAVDVDRKVLVKIEPPPSWDIQASIVEEWMPCLDSKGEGQEQEFWLARNSQLWDRILNQLDSPWRQGRSGLFDRRPVSLSLSRFQMIPLFIPTEHLSATRQRLLLQVDGKEEALPVQAGGDPMVVSPRYRMVIESEVPPSGSKAGHPSLATLRAECWWGDVVAPPHEATFSFFTCLEQYRSLPLPLRAQKRKRILRETFLQLLKETASSKIESYLTKALAGEAFQRLYAKRSARHLVKQFWSVFRVPEVRLQFQGGKWQLLAVEKAREARMYQIPYEVFGQHIFEGMTRHDEMHLPLPLLSQGLPRLYELCQAEGIELCYQGKPVVCPRWEFSLDAHRPEGIDWFELRPEIRCDGELIDAEMLQGVMKGEGIFEGKEVVHLVPAHAQEALRVLSGYDQQEARGQTQNKEWVRVPRLQILDWLALRKQGITIRLPPEDEAILDRLMHLERMDVPPLPKHLAARLRPYQQNGYAWLAFLYGHRFGACLADDMGLGKTLQAISLLGGIKEGIIPALTPRPMPHLVVVPPTLLFNWEQEIQKFYPSLRISVYAGSQRSRDFAECDVVLTTYGVVRRDIEALETIPFHVMIFDEAQTVKNIYAETTNAVRRLRGSFKIVMTGTPLENHLGEYFSLIDLCLPGLLGDYDAFKLKMPSASSAVLHVLTRRTKPFVLRRTKEQILKELPPKIETDVYLDLTEKQKALYQHTVAQIRPAIDDAYRTKTQAQARIIALTAILKLRQLCLSPKLLHADSHDSSPKITFTIERLRELMEAGHSALVFSQFTSFLDLVETALRAHHMDPLRLDGSTPTKKRQTFVKRFQESEGPSVFLLSLKAGGQGLNLTKASYVFHLDPWWNPAVENQASDRVHRMGQTQNVTILRVLMRHSIEEKMMALKQHKSALYHAVLEGSNYKGAGTAITKEDFEFLLGEC